MKQWLHLLFISFTECEDAYSSLSNVLSKCAAYHPTNAFDVSQSYFAQDLIWCSFELTNFLNAPYQHQGIKSLYEPANP